MRPRALWPVTRSQPAGGRDSRGEVAVEIPRPIGVPHRVHRSLTRRLPRQSRVLAGPFPAHYHQLTLLADRGGRGRGARRRVDVCPAGTGKGVMTIVEVGG